MSVLIVAIASLALDALTYVPMLNWFSIVGFCFGITAWVMGRKIRKTFPGKTDPGRKYAVPAMVMGVIGTFAGLIGILVSFVAGNLLFGGFAVF